MIKQRGQTLVMVALMMVALLALVALALDGGNAYLQRRQMQTAADAGALAAAKALCENDANWQSIGETIICEDGNGADNCVATALAGKAVGVNSEITVPTWFAGIVGVNNLTVGAYAEATCSPGLAVGNLLPFALELGGPFQTGKSYLFYDEEKEGAGMFGFVGWTNYHGVPYDYQYYDWDATAEFPPACKLKGGDGSIVDPDRCSPIVMIGDLIPSDTGNTLSSVDAELWGGKHGNETYPGWACREVVIPLVVSIDPKAKLYEVAGFARFVLTGMCPNGGEPVTCETDPANPNWTCGSSEKAVRGRFVDYVTGPLGGGDTDTGVYVVGLTQ